MQAVLSVFDQRMLACDAQVDLTKVWLTMSSIIVAFSFSFSNSIMNLFNSVILLFVVHPFDVGDALLITTTTTGSGAAEYCVVEELSLVVTAFPLVVSRNCATKSASPSCCLSYAFLPETPVMLHCLYLDCLLELGLSKHIVAGVM